MVIKIIIVLIATILSALAYRCGGMGKEDTAKPKWIPKWLRKSWVRDWLCPACLLLAVFSFWRPSSLLDWVLLLFYYGLSGGALSTYWDFTGKDNFYLHGLGCSLAAFCLLPFVPWYVLTIHMVICTVGMGRWSEQQGTDWIEEMGRGVFFIL